MGDPAEENDPPPESGTLLPKSWTVVNNNLLTIFERLDPWVSLPVEEKGMCWNLASKLNVVAGLLLLCYTQQALAEFKVGLVLDRGGKDDKSFNSSAYQGAAKAKEKLGVFLKYVEATDDNAFEPLLRAFAQRSFDVIVGIGFAQKEAITKVAGQYPKSHFAIVDAQVDAPNVRSLLFEEHEGAYLVGAIAALTSRSGKIGFVGGMDIPLIRRFALAYEAGAKKVNPQVTVFANYV